MYVRNRLFLSTLAFVAGLSSTGMTIAQDSANSEREALDADDRIVVTAQFREQVSAAVPIAVTSYDQDFLDDLGIEKLDQLSTFVPGLQIQEQSVNNPGLVIRGITSDSGSAVIEPRVSVFQNGVSISRSRGSYVPLFDLERIEVMKGPQSTLFGRSAQIGAVHMITAKRIWIHVRLTEQDMAATWRFVDRVDRPNQPSRLGQRLVTQHRDQGDFGLKQA